MNNIIVVVGIVSGVFSSLAHAAETDAAIANAMAAKVNQAVHDVSQEPIDALPPAKPFAQRAK